MTIYATLVFRHFMPAPWMEWALCGACLAFDLLVVRNATDIRLTKADIEARLAGGAEPVFLTWGEVKTRLAWLTLGALLLTAVAWYWFSHGQQPALLSQMLTGGIILTAIAYISALGIPLRTKSDLKEGETPFLFPLLNAPSRELSIYHFGYLIFHWPALLVLWGMMVSMVPSAVTGGGKGFTGTLDQFIICVFVGYFLLLICNMTTSVLLIKQKITKSII